MLVVPVGPASAATRPLFTAGPASPVSGYADGMVAADFNSDGSQDVATTDYSSGTVNVLLGDGLGHFAQAPGSPISLSTGVESIAAATLGNDTSTDLIVGNATAGTLTVLAGNGDGNFTPQPPISLPCSPVGIATGDFNGDLVEDVAVAESCGQVQVFLGSSASTPGAPIFQDDAPAGIALPGGSGCGGTAYPTAIAAGQFDSANNNDQHVDLAVLDGGGNQVDVMLGKGDGTFATPIKQYPTGVRSSCGGTGTIFYGGLSLVTGSFGGSYPDLAVGFQFDGDAVVMLGDGQGGFSAATPTRIAPRYTSLNYLTAGYFTSGGREGLAAADYWQGGGPGSASLADWVSVAEVGSAGQLTQAPGSPYEFKGLAGALVSGSFAGNLSLPGAGDDIAVLDGEGDQCRYYGVVTLINHGPNGGPIPPANVFPGDGCKIAPPTVVPQPASEISLDAATINGDVSLTQGTSIDHCEFRYGVGQRFDHAVPCKEGFGSGVSAKVSGLKGETTYEYKLVVTAGGSTVTSRSQAFETCATSLVKLPVGQATGCFTTGTNPYAASGEVDVDGVDFQPELGGQVTVDSKKLEITATGAGLVLLGGKVPVWGWTPKGLDLSLHGEVKLINNKNGKLFGFPLQGASLSASFADGAVTVSGQVSLTVLGDDVTASASVTADAGGITAAKIALEPANADPNAHELSSCSFNKPPPLGYECASVTNAKGNTYSGLVAKEPAVMHLGPLTVQDVSLTYDGSQHEWMGQGTVQIGSVLPGPQIIGKLLPTLSAEVDVGTEPFQLDGFSASDTSLNLPIGPAVLTNISFGLKLHPTFGISGDAGLTAVDGAIGIDGGFDYELGQHSGFELKLNGSVTVKSITISGFVSYDGRDGAEKVTLGGSFSRTFVPGVSATLGISGGVEPHHFELDGNGKITVAFVTVDGSGVVSDAGIGACGQLNGPFGISFTVGFTHLWSAPSNGTPQTDLNSGCDFSGIQTVGAGQAVDAAAGRSIQVAPGLPREEIAAVGRSAPPAVKLVGPHGETLTTPTTANHFVFSRVGAALAMTSSNTTYFILSHPPGGRWRIAPEPGAAAPIRYEYASPLKPFDMRARVTGRSNRRSFRWQFTAQPGMSVRFYQTGGTERTVIQTRRGSGRTSFQVAPGPGGPRHVLALVSLDGLPRKTITVSTFRASAPRLPAVARARYRVRRGYLRVTWSGVRKASSYRIQARLSTGGFAYSVARSSTSARFRLARGVRVRKVTVTVSVGGLPGRSVTATNLAKRAPRHHHRR